MSAAVKSYRFEVSEYYFRLTSESVRLFSNSVLRHTSIAQVVDERSSRVSHIASLYLPKDMKEHLSIIPTDGDIELEVTILESSAATIDKAIPEIAEALGTSIRFEEALSLLLYDWVVERNTTEVLTKLGLTSEEAQRYRAAAKRIGSNVISFTNPAA